MTYDTIIIGAGPAGLTAAIYTGRNRLKTLVLGKDVGGQTAISGEVENYPGIDRTQGIDLAEKMRAQAQNLETVEVKAGEEYKVKSIEKTNNIFAVVSEKGERYEGKTIILTAGKDPKRLNVPGEKEFEGRGVNYCATCDAPLYRDKIVAIIGGGYSATEAAEMLSKYAREIFVLSLNEKLNGEAITLEKIATSGKIKIIPLAETTQIINDGQKVTGVAYKDTKTGEGRQIAVEGAFVEIGSSPNTAPFGQTIKLNQWGEVEIDRKNMTSVPGIFAAGDITSVWGKQIVIAAGQGAQAAMAVGEYLSAQR